MMMPLFALPFPIIDPVLISFGPLAIRWYALAYVAGIVGGGMVIRWLQRKTTPHLPDFHPLDQFLTYAVLGIILGGRIGYVCFYQPEFFMSAPAEIFKVWHGGMSFHGGLLGMIVATWIFCRKYAFSFFQIMDLLSVAAPIGLFFGRFANFINGELYGRASDVPWAMVFPGGGLEARHPSQIYEALLEGLLLFLILFFLARFTQVRHYAGRLSGVFLCGYAAARMVVECFREPDAFLGEFFDFFTMGQLLSLPMLLWGVFLIVRARRYD